MPLEATPDPKLFGELNYLNMIVRDRKLIHEMIFWDKKTPRLFKHRRGV